jgi:bacillithiol system protein YtxJ
MSESTHAASARGGFRPLSDGSSIDDLVQESHQHPVVLFKHDPYCGVSAAAHEEMEELEGEVVLLDVSRQHELKKQVVERTGVRHESPQVIVLRGGQVAWSASHFKITAAAVRKALDVEGAAP